MSEPHKIVPPAPAADDDYWRTRDRVGAVRDAQRQGLITPQEADRQIAELNNEHYVSYLRDWDNGFDSARR